MDQPERRRGVRKTPKGGGEPGWIETEGRRIPVLVLDESIGGLGVVAVNWPDARVGAEVVFQSSVRSTEGRIASVRHVTLAGSRVYRIGLEWSV
jgi:hypothetical protein